jgi:CDP-diacylglycerol---glycerol-3-phosphate 3-phosphatidyltransferase
VQLKITYRIHSLLVLTCFFYVRIGREPEGGSLAAFQNFFPIFLIMKQLPNILSVLRIILAPIFFYMYIQDELLWRSLSVAVFTTAAVTDFFDGYIARHYKAESATGVFLDPLADKFLTFAGFICLPFLDSAQFPWWAVGLIVLRDVAVTVFRIYANKKNLPIQTRFTAKLKTMLQMIFLYVVLLAGVFIQADIMLSGSIREIFESGIFGWAMILIVIITVYSGVEYFFINKKLFK